MYSNQLKPKLGQVWTPRKLAELMASRVLLEIDCNQKKIKILDPSVGPATFFNAFDTVLQDKFSFLGLDVDQEIIDYCRGYVKSSGVVKFQKCDFLAAKINEKYDVIIANPPYIRHELLSKKYKEKTLFPLIDRTGFRISKKSNYFSYFLLKSLECLSENGALCFLVYDSILHTAYGKQLLNFIDENFFLVEKIQTKAPFEDVLIDAVILVVKKTTIDKNIVSPVKLDLVNHNYVGLEKLLNVCRGMGFPKRKWFFVKSHEDIDNFANPIIVKPKKCCSLIVCEPDNFFLDPKKKPDAISQLPEEALKILGENYGYNHKKSGVIFNYYLRGKAPHLLNISGAFVADNFYLLKSKHEFSDKFVWLLMNCKQYTEAILKAARPQGNGLNKIQLFEYRNVAIPDWRNFSEEGKVKLERLASEAKNRGVLKTKINQAEAIIDREMSLAAVT